MSKSFISNTLFVIGGLAAIVLVVFGLSTPKSASVNGDNVAYAEATVYKSPTCGCCTEYIEYLKDNGVDVTIQNTEDMSAIKEQFNIPEEMESCHTTVMGDYFFEGHIPFDVMSQMMNEHLQVDGLALPAMPMGSPGMPGDKTEPFHIHQLIHGEASTYMMA
jgi:hypothetical protein